MVAHSALSAYLLPLVHLLCVLYKKCSPAISDARERDGSISALSRMRSSREHTLYIVEVMGSLSPAKSAFSAFELVCS